MSSLPIDTTSAPSPQPPAANPAANPGSTPSVDSRVVVEARLMLAASLVDDLEDLRIRTNNRIGALAREGVADRVDLGPVAGFAGQLEAIEHGAVLELKRAFRTHPLAPWVKDPAQRGLGEKQIARLLYVIGWPTCGLNDSPRTVSQLWAYCGYHVLHPSQVCLDTQMSAAGVDPSPNPTKHHPTPNNAPSGSDPSPRATKSVPTPKLPPSSSDPSPAADHATSDTPHTPVGGGTLDPTPHEPIDTHRSHGGGVAPRRTRGARANWSTLAKTRAYLCAEAAVKAGVRKTPKVDDTNGYDHANRTALTTYGQTYLDGRAKYADAIHPTPCARCGPAGKPAEPGSPLSDGHKHARAMRLVAKAILRDLWREAHRLDLEKSDR